jgi:hypothetical protein
MQEIRANTCIQLVVMGMSEQACLPNIISKNMTQKWKRKQRMWMKKWMTKARLQPQQSPKRTGNIFTAGLITLFLNIPFYF